MTIRKFGTIKSLLHFDYPYFNEPNDGLGDEVSGEVWTRVGNTKLAGNEIPYDIQGSPKFGYRCAYFPDTTSAIQGTNASGIFNLSPSGSYEIEAFVKYTGAGNIFIIGDLVLAVNSTGQLTLLSETSETALTVNTWQHILLRLKNGAARVFLDGIEVLSAVLPAILTEPETITLGGYVGYMDEFCLRHSAGTGTPTVPTQPYSGKLNVNKVGGFGTGVDGDVTISSNSQINSYGMISTITDAKTFTISSWSNGTYTPAVGSEVMIHITAPRSTESANYPLVGLYVFRKIESLDGTNITLSNEISTENGDDFTLSSSLLEIYYVQIITVPNFTTLTVNAGITINPLTWGTSTGGGIVAFRCTGDSTINGSILTHGYGAIRYDWHQMTHSKLIDRFLCSQGGGIFITCGGTFTASNDARLGASWSGLGDADGNGAAGYGGRGQNFNYSSGSNSDLGATFESSGTAYGGSGGVGGGGSGCAMGIARRSTYGSEYGQFFNGTNAGSNGISCNVTSGTYAVHNPATGGGGCGGNGGTPHPADVYYRFDSGGAPGGNGGGYSRSGNSASVYVIVPGGIAGSCLILICTALNISPYSISIGGANPIDGVHGNSAGYGKAATVLGTGGGGTGFCYIACKAQVSNS